MKKWYLRSTSSETANRNVPPHAEGVSWGVEKARCKRRLQRFKDLAVFEWRVGKLAGKPGGKNSFGCEPEKNLGWKKKI